MSPFLWIDPLPQKWRGRNFRKSAKEDFWLWFLLSTRFSRQICNILLQSHLDTNHTGKFTSIPMLSDRIRRTAKAVLGSSRMKWKMRELICTIETRINEHSKSLSWTNTIYWSLFNARSRIFFTSDWMNKHSASTHISPYNWFELPTHYHFIRYYCLKIMLPSLFSEEWTPDQHCVSQKIDFTYLYWDIE